MKSYDFKASKQRAAHFRNDLIKHYTQQPKPVIYTIINMSYKKKKVSKNMYPKRGSTSLPLKLGSSYVKEDMKKTRLLGIVKKKICE